MIRSWPTSPFSTQHRLLTDDNKTMHGPSKGNIQPVAVSDKARHATEADVVLRVRVDHLALALALTFDFDFDFVFGNLLRLGDLLALLPEHQGIPRCDYVDDDDRGFVAPEGVNRGDLDGVLARLRLRRLVDLLSQKASLTLVVSQDGDLIC